MPRTSRVALLGGLALAATVGNSGLALTGGAGIDWSTTSVFYTAANPKEESMGLPSETRGMPANARVPSKWLSAASLAFLGPVVAKMMANRHPQILPELQVLSHLKVPVVTPAGANSDGDIAGRGSLGRAGLPTALLLTACAALGLRAAQRRAKGSPRVSNGIASSSASSLASLASSEQSTQEASVELELEGGRPVVTEIPLQSGEEVPYPTKFFRIMTQTPPEEVQQPAEFFRIMTDAEVPEAPTEISRSVTMPFVAEVEPVRKQSTPPSTIDENDEEEEGHPLMAMPRCNTEPVLEEKKTKLESSNALVAEIGRRGYVQTMRQKIEQKGLAVRAH